MINGKDIAVLFPIEDFIVRHGKSLKKLRLHNCTIRVEEGRTTPIRYWADVYNHLTKVLTELVELVVEFHIDGYRAQYVSLKDERIYQPLEELVGRGWDAPALEDFKVIVESRRT
jgi:hypothetical protein